jgi:ketosteroid isomerase-like protein
VTLTRDKMASAIRGYFDACTRGDAAAIAAYFAPDGTHYFPDGSAFGALRGPAQIARCWVQCVRDFGSSWTVDNLVADPDSRQAVIEWTHFKPKVGQVLRGDEWYLFDERGFIREIRAYYASPTHPGRAVHAIGSFDYAGRGYPMAPAPAPETRR